MRIVFLSKRHYMRRDVLNDRYGRLYQLPTKLAANGAQVDAFVTSYRLAPPKTSSIVKDGVAWRSYVLPVSLGAYLRAIGAVAGRADVVVVSSDCFHVALGGWIKEKYKKPLVVDLYDNYESFGMARLPFIRHRYHRGLRAADLICCNGDMLVQYARDRARAVETIVLRSTIDKNVFQAKPKHSSRVALGLHGKQRLVGMVGGLSASRGVQYVYEACRNLVNQGFELGLVLAGGADARWPIPIDKWVTYLGDLPHDKMVDFYNAVDLNVIQVRPDAFGKYCFPQKADEILATGAPFIAAGVGELASVFRQYPEILFDPEDVEQIQAVIRKQILSPTRVSVKNGTWTDAVRHLHSRLEYLYGDRRGGGPECVTPSGRKI
jgi:teichuronic acid biosynthesis glycosyltransferase TuaC